MIGFACCRRALRKPGIAGLALVLVLAACEDERAPEGDLENQNRISASDPTSAEAALHELAGQDSLDVRVPDLSALPVGMKVVAVARRVSGQEQAVIIEYEDAMVTDGTGGVIELYVYAGPVGPHESASARTN